MGGTGTGRWYRWDRKTTEEEVHRIDLRYLQKHGPLAPFSSGNLTWSCRGELSGSIRFCVKPDQMVLIYRAKANGGDWQSMEEPVWFDRTPCNYGGERLWFLCPDCRSRVVVLYGTGLRFLCRSCSNLSYASQNETLQGRMMRKSRKIRRRLGASESLFDTIWQRPKGMHKRTFQALRERASEAEAISWAETVRHLPGLKEHMP